MTFDRNPIILVIISIDKIVNVTIFGKSTWG